MRNTGILYSSTERKPVVLPELVELLPPPVSYTHLTLPTNREV